MSNSTGKKRKGKSHGNSCAGYRARNQESRNHLKRMLKRIKGHPFDLVARNTARLAEIVLYGAPRTAAKADG